MKRPEKDCWVRCRSKKLRKWAKNVGVLSSELFNESALLIPYYHKNHDRLYAYSEIDAESLDGEEIKSIEEFKALFEEEKKIEITEEQAKQLPVDVLKVVAPHLIDRSVDMMNEIVFKSMTADRSSMVLNDRFDYIIEGNILTPLKKL